MRRPCVQNLHMWAKTATKHITLRFIVLMRLELQLVETPQTAEQFLCGRNLHNIMG